jgi:hypothetical protein
MIGEEEMNLPGEPIGPRDGIKKHIERVIAAIGTQRTAVNDFLEDDVAIGMFIESGELLNPLEVAMMVVQIAGNDEVADAGEVDHVAIAQGIALIEASAEK